MTLGSFSGTNATFGSTHNILYPHDGTSHVHPPVGVWEDTLDGLSRNLVSTAEPRESRAVPPL